MKKLIIIAGTAILTATLSFAGEGHDDGHSQDKQMDGEHGSSDSAAGHGSAEGHGDAGGHEHAEGHAKMMAVGMPGKSEDVDRTIDVAMLETDDGDMIFEPMKFDIKQGETIRFNVINNGELEHEFVIDTIEGNVKHKGAMAAMDMAHDDPNSVRLEPGQSDDVIWNFANAGTFEFACLIPGHYESGMYGPIEVAEGGDGHS